MVRPSRRGRMRALLTSEESTGVADGDNKDWDEGGIFDPATGSQDQWKQPVRVASTASVTVSTALNAGDTIDGVTLAAGDRVLLKDQSTASQNGIYVAGTTPARAADMDDDAEVMGALVYVIAGTANGGKAYKNTNTSLPTVGSTSLTFTEFGAGGSSSFATPAIVLGTVAAAGAASTVIRSDATIVAFDATSPTTQAFGDSAVVGSAAFSAHRDHKHAMPTAAVTTSGLTQTTARILGRTTASTGAIEEITVGTGLSLSAGSLTATGGGGGTGNVSASAAVTVDYGKIQLLTVRATANTEDDDFDAGSGSLNVKWLAYTGFDMTYSLSTLPGWLRSTSAGAKLQAVPAGDWTIETEVVLSDIGAGAFQNDGLILTNGTTRASATEADWYLGQNNGLNSYRFTFEKFVNAAFSASYSSWVTGYPASHYFLRMNKSSTTYTAEFSVAGSLLGGTAAGWQRFFQTSSLGFTPTHFGLAAGGSGALFNYFRRY